MSETALPTLAPLSEAPDTLELRKESWKENTLDLVAGDTPFARIDYSYWSGKAKAELAGGAWAFSRPKGWLGNTFEVRDGADGPAVAKVDLDAWGRGGDFELEGHTYDMDAEGWLKPAWVLTRGGRELFTIKDSGSLGKKKATVTLTAAGREDPNLGLLLLLTLHAKAATDMSGAMATTASTGAIVAATS